MTIGALTEAELDRLRAHSEVLAATSVQTRRRSMRTWSIELSFVSSIWRSARIY
jgi:hypothetical protein